MLKAWCKDCGSSDIRIGAEAPFEYYLEYHDYRSDKFWHIKRKGLTVYTTFGKCGSKGVTTVKYFDSVNLAGFYMNRMLSQKEGRGYERAQSPR